MLSFLCAEGEVERIRSRFSRRASLEVAAGPHVCAHTPAARQPGGADHNALLARSFFFFAPLLCFCTVCICC